MAKQPEFRLEQILKYRKEVERLHQLELAAAKVQQENTRAQLKSEKNALDELAKVYNQRQMEGIDAAELQLYGNFSMRKKKEIRNLGETLVGLEKVVKEKHEALITAAKEKKALEVFKEKKMRDLKHDQLIKERDFMDEIAVQSRGGKK
ncbi:flagellar export protein FliJ [Geomesophilobacter sediminis]|uniref:Flagellar FliJ protein n=1 Tax=Geomesophilobacter sediminis TaxID=2798584 RepID=A0A8J7LYG2_9BACT|nr:flagellar export protein FliJ [Geomesophilobacter sediminis]MBJ6724747.1 flagellar export protein FliJ [Geomesophilobacter sediminis]